MEHEAIQYPSNANKPLQANNSPATHVDVPINHVESEAKKEIDTLEIMNHQAQKVFL